MSRYNIIILGTRAKGNMRMLLLLLLSVMTMTIHAQVIIKGSVYGGACQANVGNSTVVEIGADNHDVLISAVYGGNDISGTIGYSENLPTVKVKNGNTVTEEQLLDEAVDNGITKTAGKNTERYNAFVRISPEKTTTTTEGTTQDKHIFIGNLFGGGNGDYTYGKTPETSGTYQGKYIATKIVNNVVKVVASSESRFIKPVLNKTYLEIKGGTIAYVYGGGNNATVEGTTDICINNKSEVTTAIPTGSTGTANKLADATYLAEMGIASLGENATRKTYHFSRVFGGNNKAPMHIQPKWHLEKGAIENLYSGGNEGKMTNPNGILLEIPESSDITVYNVYGGCRKANVEPLQEALVDEEDEGTPVNSISKMDGYYFPANLAARVLIRGGNITNVYGGNDISGKVFFGNAVGVYTSISGDIYGGGNGSYAYTDNVNLKDNLKFGDYYYEVPDGKTSVQALNDFRPNAEQVSICVAGKVIGTGESAVITPTIIGGGIYVGGNSATLQFDEKHKSLEGYPKLELKIGSSTYADKVFLGNNGENMVTNDILRQYAGYVDKDGNVEDASATGYFDFSQMNLKSTDKDANGKTQFDYYMDGCAMSHMPSVVFEDKANGDRNNYDVNNPAYFGSFYCGGNVGSMIYAGKISIDFDHPVVIFNRLVGGCNNAYIPGLPTNTDHPYNAEYQGGVIGALEKVLGDGNKDKLELNLSGLRIEPKRWKDPNDKSQLLVWNTVTNGQYQAVTSSTTLTKDKTYYTLENENYIGFTADGTEVADGTNYYSFVKTNTIVNTGVGSGEGKATEEDLARRLLGGNIYGGCCESGVVNGNVIINVNSTIMDRDKLFDKVTGGDGSLYGDDLLTQKEYNIEKRRTGVILGQQGMDVLGMALNLFGGGKGNATEIWGSTTINLNRGYVFQVFGGSEEGVIGHSSATATTGASPFSYLPEGKTDNADRVTRYMVNDDAYSCYVNLKGSMAGVPKSAGNFETLPECEFIYGGGFQGPIAGNTVVRLGNGRIFNSFAGSCDADILGHTETYVGYRHNVEDEKGAVTGQTDGFPWIRDIVYGGNDLGGEIKTPADFSGKVRVYDSNATDDLNKNFNVRSKIYNENVLTASSYVEYLQGYAGGIYGGHFGTYDYSKPEYSRDDYHVKPFLGNAFVNFRPTTSPVLKNPDKSNTVNAIYGGSQGQPGDFDSNRMQDRSYVLIDIPQDMENYKDMRVFGAGSWGGLGMKVTSTDYVADKDKGSAIIDLVRGQIGAVYGASYKAGFTRRTVVNVPEDSEINVSCIFGGGYGESEAVACDVYEANVNYNSRKATILEKPQKDAEGNAIQANLMTGAIYGGNNNARGTYYSKVNIHVPVYNGRIAEDATTKRTGTVYGAGNGANTWSQYTQVNLYGNLDVNGDPIEDEPGAEVYEVYGGGNAGEVLNKKTLAKLKSDHASGDDKWEFADLVALGLETEDADLTDGTPAESNHLVTDYPGKYAMCNTNVHIHKGAIVNMYLDKDAKGNPRFDGGYAYGGGKGATAVVSGSTYIGLLGGTVKKDLYAGGFSGPVYDKLEPKGTDDKPLFTATTHAYIRGGSTRNVFGGSYEGSIGKHEGAEVTINGVTKYNPLAGSTNNDVLAVTHVVIGIREDQVEANFPEDIGSKAGLNFFKGIPTVQRNAYSGGEGGAVYGTANLLINNGYIGYEFEDKAGVTYTSYSDHYKEKIEDETWFGEGKETRLEDLGSAYGGGYDDLSSVDYTNVIMYGGVVRNSLYGGGEIATIGRGTTKATTGKDRELHAIYLPGKTHIEMYNGHVLRDVFGGGKGYNKLKYGVGHELYTDGYVFGKTEVYVHGGEIGTAEGLAKEYGNVFGGGNIGYVYSSGYDYSKHTRKENTDSPGHIYYYDKDENNEYVRTEDCKVVIAPYLQVADIEGNTIFYDGKTYYPYDYVPTDYLNKLGKKTRTQSVNGKTVKEWPTDWNKLITAIDENTDRGIVIHNAVFAGGNVATNTDRQTYANATTVFGNVTATLYDVYHRDFISVGTEHIGGLYGGGNFSKVDGYRELNITNYGTDYFSLDQKIDLDEYRTLSNRERAYFKLKYQCTAENGVQFSKDGVPPSKTYYKSDEPIDEDDYLKLVNKYGDQVSNYFETYGLCSIYAGRLLNTIQRADLCGVFGSRMVLQGAKDRVANTDQSVDFTINRVSELSLNKKRSVRTTANGYTDYYSTTYNPTSDPDFNPTNLEGYNANIAADHGDDAEHGNYFGIYSVVNFMGNLTSDEHFSDPYVDSNKNKHTDETFYSHKTTNHTSVNRNKGHSPHQVALASGVHLELIKESDDETKEYGYITGIIELDLINVKRDKIMGGGFVYAKNEHRVPMYYAKKENVILSEYNKQRVGIENGNPVYDEAITYKRFRYAEDDEGSWPGTGEVISGVSTDFNGREKEWQTSGNFIHPTKSIVDDCYPINNAYIEGIDPYSDAHYWYVKGEVYVYDQVVTAYTGSAAAYDKEALLNLTITAASNGKLQLLNVKPNLYAYYMPKSENDPTPIKIGSTPEGSDDPVDKVTVNNEHDTYKLNDVITWWDWHQLNDDERAYFVTETYTNCVDCKVDGQLYKAGTYVMNKDDYDKFMANQTPEGTSHTYQILNSEDQPFLDDNDNDIGKSYVFRPSNNISHDNGYVLTFKMSTPEQWGDYYTPASYSDSQESITAKTYEDGVKNGTLTASDWRKGPTFNPIETKVYGKQEYSFGDIITASTYEAYKAYETQSEVDKKVERAYVPSSSAVTYTFKDYNCTEAEKDGTDEIGNYILRTSTANLGTAVPYNEITDLTSAEKLSLFAPARICINTVKLADGVYLGIGELKTEAEIANLKSQYAKDALGNPDPNKENEIEEAMKEAYFCYHAGTFGGQQLSSSNNYSAIEAWCGLPYKDRITVNENTGAKTYNFDFNYDALDLLGDSDYLKISTGVGHLYPETSETIGAYGETYGEQIPITYIAKKGNETLTRQEFEALTNYKRHYTHVNVTDDDGETVYIAHKNFTYNGVPYGKGQIVDEDIWLANKSGDDPSVIDKFFEKGDYYYCYEDYSEGSTSVARGTVIGEETYSNLTNDQEGWIIQGEEPKETTMFYVSCESDIYDVSKEKILTVVYQYTYYENEGEDIKLTNELHVINIHLQLESGVPTIGPLTPPDIVLPGNAVNMGVPDVTIGSYPPLGNGWEVFESEYDAKMHRNGVPYENRVDPLYWYQNGEYYINYYSKNYLGKMYAPNPVPLKVANYHDLDAVMNDKAHHMYVDHPKVERASKIYIDNRTCESDPNKNELDLLKDFFDLSLLDDNKVNKDDDTGLITTDKATGNDSPFKGHALLDSHIHGARNLEFILQSDMSPNTTWTPIGGNDIIDDPATTDIDEAVTNDGQCFEGVLHGDGHTISGLTSSLFAHLCGEVYNLGVTGSFTGAGIAETGSGYVENCWIKTTEMPAKVANENHFAVFGNPSRGNDPRGLVQVVNCYYPESNDYQTPPSPPVDASTEDTYKHGRPTQMPDKSFFNGEVAYNLNGFYLNKRYYQGINLGVGADHIKYKYWQLNNGTLANKVTSGYYPDSYALYKPVIKLKENDTPPPYMGYVENRYYDGDFVYAGGFVPSGQNERFYSFTPDPNATGPQDEEDTGHYYPIWPDDYIFFGQSLNYDHVEGLTHQNEPSAIYRSSGRLLATEEGNRIFRAPAYFGNSKMSVAHFNPNAVFATSKKDVADVEAYKGMTAIDFSGYNDVTLPYLSGQQTRGFFPPLLDDDGITDFTNVDLTRNLLVYTSANTTASAVTETVVSGKLTDEVYEDLRPDDYHTVAEASNLRQSQTIRGHWVQQSGDDYVATRDHFLVDKEEFNAPIPYTFYSTTSGEVTTGNRMWYQRLPENYVGKKKDDGTFIPNGAGWEGVSLPFKAEIVTTNTKGEITHFYNDGNNWKGHEYWLREYKGKKAGTDVTDGIFTADFSKPEKSTADQSEFGSKSYTNSFLWDTYYSYNDYDDQNLDKYPEDDATQTYYKPDNGVVNTFTNYPRLANGKPYIIGFPGERYYEFDLSGNFEAKTAKAVTPKKLDAQIITFASAPGATIGVSDTELTIGRVSASDYTFVPNYGSKTLGGRAYILNERKEIAGVNEGDPVTVIEAGSRYEVTTATAPSTTLDAVPFRPYFMLSADVSAARNKTRSVESVHSIIFSDEQTQLEGQDKPDLRDKEYGSLSIYAKRKKIVVESDLHETAEVRIVNTAGITVTTFDIEPGETVETRINNSAVYIVQTTDGRYNKKLVVR